MKTLKDAIVAAKCRKGKADGINIAGAYWLATNPIIVRRSGGDGIGQSSADVTWTLELRHYRNGEVRPTLHRSAWHQNGERSGAGDDYYPRPSIINALCIEEIVVDLKSGAGDNREESCYADARYGNLCAACRGIGLMEYPTGPDED